MRSQIFTIARFTFLEAIRNRLLWLIFAVIIVATASAEFVGALAITESIQARGAFLGAALRLCAVFVVSLFVIASGVREFNDKGVELILSLPLPRAGYYLGKLLGASLFAVTTSALFSVSLVLYAPLGQVVLWGVSLSCELLIVTALSLLCLVTLRQTTLALSAVLAFYLLARSLAAIQLIARGPFPDSSSLSQQAISVVIEAIAFLLPGLDRFTASEWLVYHTGNWNSLMYIAGQTFVYLLLLAGAALFDLYREDF